MAKINKSYAIGDTFQLSDDALDNYGEKYRGKVFTVTGVYDHYNKNPWGSDPTGSPGFDEGADSALYGSELPFDVYEWEMVAE